MAAAADPTLTSSSSSSDDLEDPNDQLITSTDPEHPANLICSLCRNFYNLGWVTGTGGGTSIAQGSHIFIAPSGVQKELMQPSNIFVMQRATHSYLRKPPLLKPSACTPLFLAAFERGARCCIHTHSQWAVLVTLLVEKDARASGWDPNDHCFEIEQIEQIKGIPQGRGKTGMLGYFDLLRVPIIENTAHEEDLTQSLEGAMEKYPDTYAVLVRRHGVYVWGDNVHKAKTQAESLDYIFRLAVEMRNLGLPWTQSSVKRGPGRPKKTPQSSATTLNQAGSNATPSRGRPKRSFTSANGVGIGGSSNQQAASPFLSPVNGTDSDDGGSVKRPRGRPRKSETGA